MIRIITGGKEHEADARNDDDIEQVGGMIVALLRQGGLTEIDEVAYRALVEIADYAETTRDYYHYTPQGLFQALVEKVESGQ